MEIAGHVLTTQAILGVLSARRFETMANLAFEFNVSVRTIQRDVDVLSTSAPIYTVCGNGGGVRFMDSQHSTRRYLSSIERDLFEEMLETVPSDKRGILRQYYWDYPDDATMAMETICRRLHFERSNAYKSKNRAVEKLALYLFGR